MDLGAAKGELRKQIKDLLVGKGDEEDFANDEMLITGGRLQSIDVIELVNFFEEEYDVDFGVHPFDPDDFESIETMLALLVRVSV